MEQCRRSNTRAEEEMMRKHVLEKKRLPKSLRDEMKVRSLMFKESLRINPAALNAEQEREKIRQVRK
jgi:STE20-like kinase